MTFRVLSATRLSSLFLVRTVRPSFFKIPLRSRLGVRPHRPNFVCRVFVSVPHLHQDRHRSGQRPVLAHFRQPPLLVSPGASGFLAPRRGGYMY